MLRVTVTSIGHTKSFLEGEFEPFLIGEVDSFLVSKVGSFLGSEASVPFADVKSMLGTNSSAGGMLTTAGVPALLASVASPAWTGRTTAMFQSGKLVLPMDGRKC